MRRTRRSGQSVAPVGHSRSWRNPHIAPVGRPRRLEIGLRHNPPPPRKNALCGRLLSSVAGVGRWYQQETVQRSPRSPPSVASIGRAIITHRPRRSRQSVAPAKHIAPVGRVNRSNHLPTSPPSVACLGRKLRHRWSHPSVALVGRRSREAWSQPSRQPKPATSQSAGPAWLPMSCGKCQVVNYQEILSNRAISSSNHPQIILKSFSICFQIAFNLFLIVFQMSKIGNFLIQNKG